MTLDIPLPICGFFRRPAMLLLAGLSLLSPVTAVALDGRLDVRGSNNEGLSGSESYTTSMFRVDSSLEQYVRLSETFFIRADYRDQYEENESRSSAFSSLYSTRTQMPAVALTYRSANMRGGMSLDGFRRDYDGAGFGQRKDERLDFATWLQMTRDRVDASLRYGDTASDRITTIGALAESRDQSLNASLRTDVPKLGEFLYTGSVNRDHNITLEIERERMSHGLRFQGGGGWNNQRGRFSVEARTDLFRESIETTLATASARLAPFFIGYVLDDTPESLDPFESQPTPLPELSDYDRDAPTPLNIGDDTEPVRQFGGDYRNLIVDFGEEQAVGSAALFIDRIVHFPEFMEWRLYTSDDPEGIEWNEAPVGLMIATYREWTNGRQGWEFAFTTPVTARRFKFVDVKTGPTEPDIFLNELELYDPDTVDISSSEITTRRHRLRGTLRYNLTEAWSVGYRTTLSWRINEDEAQNLTGTMHAADTLIRLNGWRLASLYSFNTLVSPTKQNTDTRTLSTSLTSDSTRALWTRLSWHHSLDLSLARNKTTDDIALDTTWEAAPALTFSQKVGHGMLNDEFYDLDSESWFSVSTIRSQPRRSITLDLRRSSRWVSQEASSGFTRFNDTDGTLRWAIFPLLAYSGQVRYESRDVDDWLWRHVLSWTPLSTGSLDMSFSLNYYDDTRTAIEQHGGSVNVTWNARPRLKMEGRLETQEYDRDGVKSSPFNTQYRVTWIF